MIFKLNDFCGFLIDIQQKRTLSFYTRNDEQNKNEIGILWATSLPYL